MLIDDVVGIVMFMFEYYGCDVVVFVDSEWGGDVNFMYD